MKHKILKLFLLANFCLHLTACGTILSLTESDMAVYGGVRKDLSVIQEGGILGTITVVDLPLSFVLDTLLLPVTLTQ